MLKQLKHSIRRKINTVMQDKKIITTLKERKQEILHSLLAEHNGLLILHSVDRNADMIQRLIDMQTDMQSKVSLSLLTVRFKQGLSKKPSSLSSWKG